jgi:Skp family chaperone for outer membrane proteins
MRWAALICAALMSAGVAAAQPAPAVPEGTPVLTIDQDRLFGESLFGKATIARLEAAEDALVAENVRIEAALEAEERDLTAQRPTMSPEAFRALADAFDTKVEGIRSAQRAKYTALTQAYDEDRRRFFVEIVPPLIAQTMQATGAVAVLDKKSIILSLQSIDVTEAVIAGIDAKVGDGTGVPPAGPDAQP